MTRSTRTSPRRVLITGGAGFIGSHLAEALLDSGNSVRVIDDLSTGSVENIRSLIDRERRLPPRASFAFVNESITAEAVLDRLVSECDIVIHLAAAVGVRLIIEDPVHVIETNVIGTRAVLRMAHRYGKKVVIASTSEIYGKNSSPEFEEDSDCVLGATTTARWSYAASKAIDEFLGLAYYRQMAVPVVVFRLFNTVGPRQTGQYGMVIPRFVEQALAGEPLTVYGDGQQSRCFCDVDDAVRGIIDLAEEPAAVGEVFNIGSTEGTTILSLAERVLGLVDKHRPVDGSRGAAQASSSEGDHDPRIRFVSYEEAYGPGFEDMRRRVPSIGKIRAAVGWQPRLRLDDTLRRVIEHQLSTTGESGSRVSN